MTILINPESNVRVQRFFCELNGTLKSVYDEFSLLKKEKGRKITNLSFQFRFLIWWKFFGSKPLETAIREINSCDFLKSVLQAPQQPYTREKFHYFLKTYLNPSIEDLQQLLLSELMKNSFLDWKIVIMDSFPIKSYLNSQKCLKRPPIDYEKLKNYVELINTDNILKLLQISDKMCKKVETKIIALLVKETWDIVSWKKCHQVLFDKKAKLNNISLSYNYKSENSLRGISEYLKNQNNWQKIEKALIDETCSVLIKLGYKEKSWNPKVLEDLNQCWYTPHRLRDKGISLYHCASKNIYQYGRGGIIAVIESLEIPILISLTDKYKQSEESILEFINKLNLKYNSLIENGKVLADSEFGTSGIKELIIRKLRAIPIITNYGNSNESFKISKEDRDKRKMVERVIGRLVSNWSIENPRHVGSFHAGINLQVAVLCDYLQVLFNFKIGNKAHPHAIKTFKG